MTAGASFVGYMESHEGEDDPMTKHFWNRALALVLSAALAFGAAGALAEDDEETHIDMGSGAVSQGAAAQATVAPEEAQAILDDETLDDEEQAMWLDWLGAEGSQEVASAVAELESLESDRVEIDPDKLDQNTLLPDDYFNVLLLGVDNRKDVKDAGRSDAVIIASINKKTGDIKLASIARDTAVTIPGYKSQKRINVAYNYGGPQLAMRTVNHNFQMNIEYFVTVNIFGLADIIDSLGGIDIELTKAEANRINYELRKEPMDKVKREKVQGYAGVHHLDGMQAVTFSRIRGLDDDFARTARQRKLLETLLNFVMQDMTFDRMITLMETILPYVYTNLPMNKMVEVGLSVLGSDFKGKLENGDSLLEQHRVPMDKTFGYRTINGASMVYMSAARFKANIEALHEFIYGAVYMK